MFGGPLDPSALDIAINDVAHFACIKRFADVIISAEPKCFAGRLEGAETGEHDHRKMGIDLANFAQSIDAGHSGHANIHDDRIRVFFLQKLEAGFDAIGSVHLIVRFQQHPQAFARTDFVVDNKDFGRFRRSGHEGSSGGRS